MPSLPIQYREFYDIPRAFLVERAGSVFFFDCRFDPNADEYSESYSVYRIEGDLATRALTVNWAGMQAGGTLVGRVGTTDVQFDPTRRLFIDDGVFRLLLPTT